MHCKLPKSMFVVFALIILCNASVSTLSHVADRDGIGTTENGEHNHIICLQTLAETTIDMLIATRGVVEKNQEIINRDPATGNSYVKGFVPAVAGS